MRTNVVFTFVGDDQTGLVRSISKTVSENGGNWLESRLCRMAGKFAGIVQVGVEQDDLDALIEAIDNLAHSGLKVVSETTVPGVGSSDVETFRLEVFGLDRRDIVKEIAKALAERDISVIDMTTDITPAAMTGEIMFVAEAVIEVPETVDLEELEDQLDEISTELTVEIELISGSDRR